MQSVAREAGTSRGAVYRHFAGRAALVDAVLERTAERMLDAAARRVDQQDLFAAQVAEGIRAVPGPPPEPLATALREEPYERAAWLAERWHPFWRARLASAQERHEVRDDLDLDDAADWVTRLQLSFLGAEPDDVGAQADLERFVDEHLMAGLAPR